MNWIVCSALGHDWEHKPNQIPEDRMTFECSRCGAWGYNPARAGENRVPNEIAEELR